MKIFLVGYYNPKFKSITEYVEYTLRDLGHEVETFEWNDFKIPGRVRNRFSFLHELELKRINENLLRGVKAFRPDMLFVLGGFTIFPETIIEIRSLGGIVTVNWVADYPLAFNAQMRVGQHYDHFFTGGTDGLEEYRDTYGKNNGHWLPFACYPEIHRPVELTGSDREKYGCDICFVGSIYPERVKILEGLLDFDLGIWGIGWDRLPAGSAVKRAVRGGVLKAEEWVKAYSAAKLVLNMSYSGGEDPFRNRYRMCNTKVFEILGCGAFQLMDAKPDALELFEDKKHMVFYNDIGQLQDLVREYLSDPEKRLAIAEQGRKEALEKHTYKHRFDKILDISGIRG